MTISKLLKKAKKGHKDALVQLILQEQQQFYHLAYTYVGNEQDALDALEQMIVILYEKIHQLKDDTAFYSWSKTILLNECRSILKKKHRVTFIEDEETVDLTVNIIDQLDDELTLEPASYIRTLQFNTTNEGTDLLIKNMYFLEMQTDTITIFD